MFEISACYKNGGLLYVSDFLKVKNKKDGLRVGGSYHKQELSSINYIAVKNEG